MISLDNDTGEVNRSLRRLLQEEPNGFAMTVTGMRQVYCPGLSVAEHA